MKVWSVEVWIRSDRREVCRGKTMLPLRLVVSVQLAPMITLR